MDGSSVELNWTSNVLFDSKTLLLKIFRTCLISSRHHQLYYNIFLYSVENFQIMLNSNYN